VCVFGVSGIVSCRKLQHRHYDAMGIRTGKVRFESAVYEEYCEQWQSIERDVLIKITKGYAGVLIGGGITCDKHGFVVKLHLPKGYYFRNGKRVCKAHTRAPVTPSHSYPP
jgi:hypothetical protein